MLLAIVAAVEAPSLAAEDHQADHGAIACLLEEKDDGLPLSWMICDNNSCSCVLATTRLVSTRRRRQCGLEQRKRIASELSNKVRVCTGNPNDQMSIRKGWLKGNWLLRLQQVKGSYLLWRKVPRLGVKI